MTHRSGSRLGCLCVGWSVPSGTVKRWLWGRDPLCGPQQPPHPAPKLTCVSKLPKIWHSTQTCAKNLQTSSEGDMRGCSIWHKVCIAQCLPQWCMSCLFWKHHTGGWRCSCPEQHTTDVKLWPEVHQVAFANAVLSLTVACNEGQATATLVTASHVRAVSLASISLCTKGRTVV